MTTTQPDPTRVADLVDLHLRAYAEGDAAERARLVAAAWAPDGSLVDPPADATGHAAVDGLYAALQAQFPGHAFRRSTQVDLHHDAARYGWELVGPAGDVALAGQDVALLAPDGRLARVTGFFGEPAAI